MISRTTTVTPDDTRCERCSTTTVSVGEAAAWCPSCEWNLDRYEPDRRPPEFGWRWIDRRTHALAYRLTRQQFTKLAERTLEPPQLSSARIVVTTASVLLLTGVLALAVAGAWLVATWKFPAPHILFGLALLGLAVALRPRFGRVDPKVEILSRNRAPELFRLIDEVAVAANTPAPDVVAVSEEFNAYATAVGLRRRRVLCLGLPLWGSLEPQERVALLGHELGHFVNGDVRRGLLTQPAFTALGTIADLVRPVDTVISAQSGLVTLGETLGKGVQWVLARLFFGAHLLLVWIGLRDGQRAEYLADELGARVAGSGAAASLLDAFLAMEAIEMVVRREARAGNGAAHWREAAGEARSHSAERRPLLRQLSVRDEASLFASHPPSGLRAQMIEARQWCRPAVVLTEARSEQIDTELAKDYERARRQLAWTN